MDKTLDILEKVAVPSSGTNVRILPVSGAPMEHSLRHQTEKSAPQQTQLTRVLLGLSKPSAKITIDNLSYFDTSLNPSQKEAVKFALVSPEVACIHGPPGMHREAIIAQ